LVLLDGTATSPATSLLFRAVRELLINAVKHSRADRVTVSVGRNEDHVVVSVSDDGIGFDASRPIRHDATGGFGLFSIRERMRHMGGHMDIASAPGEGTTITLTVSGQQNAQDSRS